MCLVDLHAVVGNVELKDGMTMSEQVETATGTDLFVWPRNIALGYTKYVNQ